MALVLSIQAGHNLPMTDFHKKKEPWAKIKHGILGRYIPLFANKTQLFQRPIYLVDGFAGPGRYDNGDPGSALISANFALNPHPSSLRGVFRCINVEKDKTCFAKLEESTQAHRTAGVVRNIPGEFEKKLPEILESIHQDTALFFIDPFGTAGATASTLRLISERKPVTEALIRFDDIRVKRLLAYNKNDLFGNNPRAFATAEKFFARASELTSGKGIEAALKNDPAAGRIIVQEYINLVTNDLGFFKYGLAYSVINPATKNHRYYLAHFCNHADGYVYMANFMAKVQRTIEKLVAKKEEEFLFGPINEEPGLLDEYLMNYQDDLVRKYEDTKVQAILKELPSIFKARGLYGKKVERREILAAVVDRFGFSVLLKESRRALTLARAINLLNYEKDHDAADTTIHREKV